jgi:hypothetical protein
VGQSQSAAGFPLARTNDVNGLWGIPAEVLPESCLLVVVGGKERPMTRKLVRPVPGEATPALGREHPRQLGDQGRPAIE